MSWKSIVCTGLLCVIASPVLAQPTLTVDLVRNVGGLPVLNANGDWQWEVTVTPDASLFADSGPDGTPPNTVGGSVAIEVGISASDAALLVATVNTTNFPEENFGASPFAFGGNPDDGLTISGNDLFAALGSDFFTAGTEQQVFTFTTVGPSTAGSLTTTVDWLGAYGGNARLAQGDDNFDDFVGTLSKTAFPGDVDLSGAVGPADASTLGGNWLMSIPGGWAVGDLDRSGTVGPADASELGGNWLMNQPGGGPGAGSLSASIEIPEPSSLALLAFVMAVLAGWSSRRSR